MEVINAQAAAKRWGVSVQSVLKYCKAGRVEGAIKKGKSWEIPSSSSIPVTKVVRKPRDFTFIDLFCGIGGFHQALRSLGGRCVFACDINARCRETYEKNFCPNKEFPVLGDVVEAINKKAISFFFQTKVNLINL